MRQFRLFSLGIFVLLFFVGYVSAETIYLKNGRSVTGTIIEKTDRQIKIDIDGFPLTYYLDEVDRIESGEMLSEAKEKPQRVKPGSILKNTSKSRKELALRYMEVAGVKDSLRKTFDNVIAQAPNEDKAKLTEAFDVEDIVIELGPIYEQYFTESELQDLIDFYESPTGRKVLEVNPMILKDSMEISYKYFQDKLE